MKFFGDCAFFIAMLVAVIGSHTKIKDVCCFFNWKRCAAAPILKDESGKWLEAICFAYKVWCTRYCVGFPANREVYWSGCVASRLLRSAFYDPFFCKRLRQAIGTNCKNRIWKCPFDKAVCLGVWWLWFLKKSVIVRFSGILFLFIGSAGKIKWLDDKVI